MSSDVQPTEADWAQVDLTDQSRTGWDVVSEMFGLSYAAYLVLPRAILERMPNDWQERFKGLMDQLEQEFDTSGDYLVRMRDDDKRFVRDPLSNYRHPDVGALRARRVLRE